MIDWSKIELSELKGRFQDEFLETNRLGIRSSGSVLQCNTRKYHAVFAAPQPHLDIHNYNFVAQLDEQVLIDDRKYEISNHEYSDGIFPKGYELLSQFRINKVPTWEFDLEGARIQKTILVSKDTEHVFVSYELKKGKGNVELSVNPLFSFRQMHRLSQSNQEASHKYKKIPKGIKVTMYDALSPIYIQCSKPNNFIGDFYWHLGVKYAIEENRGYSCYEDLASYGKFKVQLTKGERVVFALGLNEIKPSNLVERYDQELKTIPKTDKAIEYLKKSAFQFIQDNGEKASVIAGYPWFGRWGRDTFIALPGLMTVVKDKDLLERIFESMFADFQNGLLTNVGKGEQAKYNSVDASMWLFVALQHYAKFVKPKKIWSKYNSLLKSILEAYQTGTHYNIKVNDNGLLHAGDDGVALTWMDAVYNDRPVTQRRGYPVELQALWYNAVCFSLEMAETAKDDDFVQQWGHFPEKIHDSFNAVFWEEKEQYLADVVFDNSEKDWSIRPNQLFALNLPYPLVKDERSKSILHIVKHHLLTPKGLRTLSPSDEKYIGVYQGGQEERDNAYHQGIVWPWLLGAYCDALICEKGIAAIPELEEIWDNLVSEVERAGLGSISELFDGDLPHLPKGATSQAWSVTELLRINDRLKRLKKRSK